MRNKGFVPTLYTYISMYRTGMYIVYYSNYLFGFNLIKNITLMGEKIIISW